MDRRKTRRDSNSSMNSNRNRNSNSNSNTNMERKQPPRDVDNDKENQGNVENLLQSPTPYWKVARERGISPTETRSTKNNKKPRGTLLVFSPPDNVSNAKRGKEELQRKESERDRRVLQNKQQGQLCLCSLTTLTTRAIGLPDSCCLR
jgi:hypothetical protein